MKIDTNIDDILAVTIQEFGFIDIVPCTQEDFQNLHGQMASSIKIQSPDKYSIVLMMPRSLVFDVYKIMALTQDKEATDEVLNDTLGEIINVFVGNVCRSYYPGVIYKMTTPITLQPSRDIFDQHSIRTFLTPDNQIIYLGYKSGE